MYVEFPQEYEKLKVALEEEEFEKAEALLLMILQKNPNLPEAKLHLEKVRAKVGSISNFEFRVKAFLDQKDYETAEQIIKEAKSKFDKRLAAYNVSGEYTMIKQGALASLWDEKQMVLEVLNSLKRAGADLVITYHAKDVAKWQ